MDKMLFILLNLCLALTVNAHPATDSMSTTSTIRTIRSIANIAKLLLGGNISPDHPLINSASLNANRGTSNNVNNGVLPPLSPQTSSNFELIQSQTQSQSHSAFTPGPPYHPNSIQQVQQNPNYNFPYNQQSQPQPQPQPQYSPQYQHQQFNSPPPYNNNNGGNFGQYRNPPQPKLNQNAYSNNGQASAYIPANVIYSPPRDSRNRNPPRPSIGSQGQRPFSGQNQNQNPYQSNLQGSFSQFSNNFQPQQSNGGFNYQNSQGPPISPFGPNPPQQSQPIQNYNYNYPQNQQFNGNRGPNQFGNNLNSASTPYNNVADPTKQNSNSNSNFANLGPITSTLNAISAYIPKISFEVSATRRASDQAEADLLNSKIRRDEVITEIERQLVDTSPVTTTAQQLSSPLAENILNKYFETSTLPSENVETSFTLKNDHNYNYGSFRQLESPMESHNESPIDIADENFHVIPSVAIYHTSYIS